MHLYRPCCRLESGLALWLSFDGQNGKEIILLNFQGWVIGTLEGSTSISRNICSRESKPACKKFDYTEMAVLWLTHGEVAWRDTQPALRCPRHLSPYKWRNHLQHFTPSTCEEPRNQARTKAPDIWPQLSIPTVSSHLSHPRWGLKHSGAEISHPSPMCTTENPNTQSLSITEWLLFHLHRRNLSENQYKNTSENWRKDLSLWVHWAPSTVNDKGSTPNIVREFQNA